MAKEATPGIQSPSFARFILWEILGVVGFLHILFYAPANDPTPLFFLGNAVFFVALYPILYFYSQLKLPAVLKFLILPLSITLRILLMISSGLWITYILYAAGLFLGQASCYQVIRHYWMFLTPFYVVDYFFFFEHLWGLSWVNFTFWSSVGMISDSVSGVVAGLKLGQILITKWGIFFGDAEVQGLVWSLFILTGVAAVVWFGNKTRHG